LTTRVGSRESGVMNRDFRAEVELIAAKGDSPLQP
jgi:hypothetical protein